jgi:menaquinone-dependent protoporphyrinogen oxidase
MRVLVAYGSKRGGTEGLARAVAEGVTEAGHTVDVRSAGELESLDRWDAVIIGGALYAWHWHRDARRFVKRHVEELQQRPVWFFSSGPLDDSASRAELPPPRSIEQLMALARARHHKTFGGRLLPEEASVSPVRGDFRDLDAARGWGRQVGEQIAVLPVTTMVAVPRSMSTWHRVVLTLCAFTGLTAVLGGIGLVTAPRGSPSVPPLSVLEATPFGSFLVPGLVLLLVVGGGNLVAAVMEARRLRYAELAAAAGGALVTGWIVVQMALIGVISWMQLLYLAVGLTTLTGSIWLWRNRHRLEAGLTPRLH